MPWISNHKHKIKEKSTKSSRSSSKVVGLGPADLWEFPTLFMSLILSCSEKIKMIRQLRITHGQTTFHKINFKMSFGGSPLLFLLHNEAVGGYIGFTPSVRPSVRPSLHLSICPSVHPASHVRSVVPTVLIGSSSYLYILSSNFRRCVACKVACKILKFEFSAIS